MFRVLLLSLTTLAGCACLTCDDGASAAAPSDTTPAETAAMPATAPGLYALQVPALDGRAVDLSRYAGQVSLVVNVASACGYTPQYAGLQELHATYGARGLQVLGFPSNEFGGQEPGSAQQIQEFCSSKFGVTFPMFSKCEVKPGPGQSPVYSLLAAGTGSVPNWNFCKYLVGRDGQVIAFFPSKVAPDDAALKAAIEKALAAR